MTLDRMTMNHFEKQHFQIFEDGGVRRMKKKMFLCKCNSAASPRHEYIFLSLIHRYLLIPLFRAQVQQLSQSVEAFVHTLFCSQQCQPEIDFQMTHSHIRIFQFLTVFNTSIFGNDNGFSQPISLSLSSSPSLHDVRENVKQFSVK